MSEAPFETRRMRRKDRLREQARKRRLEVTGRIFDGSSVAQIAEDQKISLRRLNQLLQIWGIAVPRRQGCRPLPCVYLAGARAAWLDRLAAEAGCSPSEMAARILSVNLADVRVARRLLGKLALPTKSRSAQS